MRDIPAVIGFRILATLCFAVGIVAVLGSAVAFPIVYWIFGITPGMALDFFFNLAEDCNDTANSY